MNNCLVTTKEIRHLTEKLQGETEESVKGLVALWQKENNKSIEEYPSAKELNDFRFKLRSADAIEMLDEALSTSFDASKISSIEEQAKVDLDFDPRTRRDRVNLIARFFSNEVDKALQEMNDSLNKRMDTASDEERLQLQMELSSLNRFDAIKKYTPAGLFDRVLDIFQSYINDTEENRVQIELGAINAREQTLIDEGVIDESERFSDEQKLDAARRKAVYKEQAYRKVVDNFKPLAEEASTLLVMTEGVRIDLNYIAPKDANLNDDTPEGYSELDEQADDYNKEETFKDGWMTNFRQVSREIPRLDYEGMYEEDDLGNLRYLDADYVHATLIDKLRDMITSEDMIPLIQEL